MFFAEYMQLAADAVVFKWARYNKGSHSLPQHIVRSPD